MELPKFFYYAFGGVAMLLLSIAAYIFYLNQVAANNYVKVEGVIIKNQFRGGMARPVIRFQWNDESKVYASNAYSSPPAYQRDEVVELFVNPNNPEDVVINNFLGRYLAMTIVGSIGLFFLGFLILFHFVFTKKQ
jgi:hypothetical protein